MSTWGGGGGEGRGHHEYIGECSVHRRDIIMHVGGHHEYIGGCSVH